MTSINIIGYGQMGRQIASLLSLLDFNVTVYVRKIPEQVFVEKQKRIISKQLSISMNNNSLKIVKSLNELSNNSITIETISEDINIKRDIYREVSNYIECYYYTNSSSYSPNEIGDMVGGLHFFNPISLRIIEHCSPKNGTNDDSVRFLNILKKYSFNVINVHQNRGYLVNSLLFREISNIFLMIEIYKYDLSEINYVYSFFYNKRSIFDIIDLVGVDVTYSIIKNLNLHDDRVYLPFTLKNAIDNKILGKKNNTSIRNFLLND